MDLCQQSDIFVSQTLSRFVIAFLLRSKHLLTSWLQSLSAVVLEPKKVKSVTSSTFSPSICHEVIGLGLPRWCSGKEYTCQCRRHKRCRFSPWVEMISWSMSWQPTLIFLPGKFMALTIWMFVGKVISLLFNTVSKFVIDFLPTRKHLLISWLLFPAVVILETKKIKTVTVSTISPI